MFIAYDSTESGRLRSVLGAPWGPFGRLGGVLGCLGVILARLGGVLRRLEASWGHLGSVIGGLKGILWMSWGREGVVLERLGASWDGLGRLGLFLEACWRATKNVGKPFVLQCFGAPRLHKRCFRSC